MNDVIEKKKELGIPVKVGQELVVIPTGMAERDPYVDYNGFIIFIKRLPLTHLKRRVSIRITGVKETYAFSEYRNKKDGDENNG